MNSNQCRFLKIGPASKPKFPLQKWFAKQLSAAAVIILLLAMLLLPIAAQAQFQCWTNDDSLTIMGYTGSGGAVTIPSLIGGLPVTSIADYAFSSPDVTSIKIPSSVISVGDKALYYCPGLSGITVDPGNSSYSSAGGVLFNKDKTTLIRFPGGKGGNYTIPESVTSIEDSAFFYCPNLTKVAIPDSVVNISAGEFNDCFRLSAFAVDPLNPSFSSIDGFLTDKTRTTLVRCPGGKIGKYTVPNSITGIADGAFIGCSSLTGVTIPSSVTSIGAQAFYQCFSLTAITVDPLNPSYSSVNGVLFDKDQTTLIQCPGGKSGRFTIPDTVIDIGDEAFEYSRLTSIQIPASVVSIGNQAFYYCGSLNAITVDPLNDSYCSVDGILFDKSMATLIQCPSAKAGSLTIPSGVANIGDWAFSQCTNLTSIIISDGVTNIGNEAFIGCSRLASVTVPASLSSIGDEAFGYCSSLNGMYFLGDAPPDTGYVVFLNANSVTNYYLPKAFGWDTTFCDRPAKPWVLSQPKITSQPRDLTLVHGADATFQVTAAQEPALTYQWLKDGAPLEDAPNISGARSATLVLHQVRLEDKGAYSVTVNNPSYSASSRSASLSVVADPPILQIITPVKNQRFSNILFSVSGKASDKLGIADSIQVRVNAGPWVTASTTNGWTNWTATAALNAPGTNWIIVQAEDLDGVSSSISNAVIYVVSDRLSATAGNGGSITPDYNNSILEIGKPYSLTAQARPGFVFSNWTGGVFPDSRVLTNSLTLHFLMQSNLVLQANFVPNPFLGPAGSFAGLFYNTNSDGVTVSNAGYFTARVTPAGAFSAKLQQGAKSYLLSGRFAVDGTWQTPSIKGAPGLSASLQLDLAGGDAMTGRIGNGSWTAEIQANRAIYSKANPAHAGQYTLIIPGSSDPSNLPGGHGALAVSVSSLGAVSVVGALGDGEPVTLSTLVSSHGQWPLYSAPYAKSGILIGWLTFTNNTTNDLEGVVSWIKPGQPKAKLYPNGFDWPYNSATPNAFGSAFTLGAPASLPAKTPAWPLNWTNGVVTLEAGNLPQTLTNAFSIGAANKVTATNGLKLTLTTTGPKAGLFSGSVVTGPGAKITNVIHGALLQNQNIGLGWFLGTNQSGSVTMTAD